MLISSIWDGILGAPFEALLPVYEQLLLNLKEINLLIY